MLIHLQASMMTVMTLFDSSQYPGNFAAGMLLQIKVSRYYDTHHYKAPVMLVYSVNKYIKWPEVLK
jgi:hypothetical protein